MSFFEHHEKIDEILMMIRKGKLDDALESLEMHKKHAFGEAAACQNLIQLLNQYEGHITDAMSSLRQKTPDSKVHAQHALAMADSDVHKIRTTIRNLQVEEKKVE